MFIQTFIPEPAVETLFKTVLGGFARFDEAELHSMDIGQFVWGLACELCESLTGHNTPFETLSLRLQGVYCFEDDSV